MNTPGRMTFRSGVFAFVRRASGRQKLSVVPAKAGTHNHRRLLLQKVFKTVPKRGAAGYGSRLALRLAGTTAEISSLSLGRWASYPPSAPWVFTYSA